ncbi:MAG TPA: formylglycine-generating enzyme family protein [Opitutales bacterium]|nr:formylglycine-generating enzyme family protein [Opitutales bacterium]
MKKCLIPVFAFTALACAAAPIVTVSSVGQDAGSRLVTVVYALENAPAIITFGMETNRTGTATEVPADWIAVEDGAIRHVWGDVNRIVRSGGSTYTIHWRPDFSWPYHAFAANAARAVVKAWTLADPPDYAVFDLTITGNVMFYTDSKAFPYDLTNDVYKTDCLVMRRIPAKNVKWRMGAPAGEPGRATTGNMEQTHDVTLTNDFYMGVYEFTQRQLFLTTKQAVQFYHVGDKFPADGVKWQSLRGDADTYSWPSQGHAVDMSGSVLGLLRTLSGQDFDLPTEAQWEYAARAGTGTAFSDGSTEYWSDAVMALSWYRENSATTHEVGLCPPNAWGLYDVHGNVAEWCLDWMSYDITSYTIEPGGPEVTPPDVQYVTGCRVVRGGSYGEQTVKARSARRGWDNPKTAANGFYGARLCLPLPLK